MMINREISRMHLLVQRKHISNELKRNCNNRFRTAYSLVQNSSHRSQWWFNERIAWIPLYEFLMPHRFDENRKLWRKRVKGYSTEWRQKEHTTAANLQ